MRHWVLLLICLFPVALYSEEIQPPGWSQSGMELEEPKGRGGFSIGLTPHAGAVVKELGRAAAGAGIRLAYGLSDSLSIYLENDWTLSQQFDVSFHFLDFYPHLSYFVWKDLYILGGGGLSLVRTTSGTSAAGFSPVRAVTERAFGGELGFGVEVLNSLPARIGIEFSSVYRRISPGHYFQPQIRAVFTYQF